MTDAPLRDFRERIVDEAAEWFARMQDAAASNEDRVAFADWLCASSQHVREYLALTALHADIGELPACAAVEDLICAAAGEEGGNVIALDRNPAQANSYPPIEKPLQGGGWFRWRHALAAGIAAVALACGWWLWNGSEAVYSTGIGEQKSFTLADGSVVTLNAVSQIQTSYTDRHRDIRLLSGEALFDVAKIPQRPFRVLTKDRVIEAVGTRFNVRHRDRDTTVTVLEGRVAVSSAPLEPGARQLTTDSAAAPRRAASIMVGSGEQITLTSRATGAPQQTNIAVATAWRERRLVFQSRRLSEVVAEFNLYNEPQLQIRDPALNEVQISGNFYANDPESFALFLEEARLATSQTESGGILLSPPARRENGGRF